MMIEDLLNTIPLRIKKVVESNCPYCNTSYKYTCEYTLKIDVSQHEKRQGIVTKRYKMFYETSSFTIENEKRYIGRRTGLGFETLKEAFNDLTYYLDERKSHND